MTDRGNVEKAQTAQEARDEVVSRPSGPGRAARDEAMRRYLAAEQYHEKQERHDEDTEQGGA